MHAYPGLDPLDPQVSPRRLWVLANRLPPGARLPGQPWSEEAHLLALVVDHLAQLTWIMVRANGGKGKRPRPLPRPDARQQPGRPPPPTRAAPPGGQPSGRMSWAAFGAALAGMQGIEVT